MKLKKIIFPGLVFLILTTAFASAGTVAYIYRLSNNIDQNFINALTDKGFTVTQIQYSNIDQTDFSQYDLVLVGDEFFADPNKIPVNKYPTLIVNTRYLSDWNWLDNNGISSMASNQPLQAKNVITHSITNNLSSTIQIYDQCCYDESGLGLPVYYLYRFSKDPDILTVTSTTINNNDAIIGIAEPGDRLFNNKLVQARGCFFGIVESDHWTNYAETLFQNCALWAAYGADNDGDGYHEDQDCDDNNANVNPGKTEIIYNGKDDDCNPNTLDDDLDQDGYNHTQDCNDNDNTIYPGAVETPYDGIDQDCDNQDLIDVDNDSYNAEVVGGNDCDDNDDTINPGVVEIPYDGIDQDCDNQDLTDVDNDGYDAETVGGNDCNDNNADINPGQNEIPNNGIDDDCNANTLDNDSDQDGIPDNQDNCPNVANQNQEDLDNDGLGDVCDQYPNDYDNDGYETNEDCDDTAADIYPGAPEILDNIDQNCQNDAPTLEDFAEINVVATYTATITAMGSDVDGDTLTYQISDTRFEQNNNIFTWETSSEDTGTTITVNITVSDGEFEASKEATVNVLQKIVLNEFVIDPQTDWNNNGFISNNDRWIELYNPSNYDVNLENWKISLGTFDFTNHSLTGTLNAKDYYVLLDPDASILYSAGQIILYNNEVEVDKITYGSLNDGNLSDNAYRYEGVNASGTNDECVARLPNGYDTDVDNEDWFKNYCTYWLNNEADLDAPIVKLMSPADNSEDDDGNVEFTFNATNGLTANCSLYTDITGIFEAQYTIVVNDTYVEGTFAINNIPDNLVLTWNVECSDEYNNKAFAENNYTLTININDPPELTLYKSVFEQITDVIFVNETAVVTIIAIATDEETAPDNLVYYINDTRFNQSFNVFTWQTNFSDGETFTILITVSDGELNTSKEVTITILNNDDDDDGYNNQEDCDDNNENINPAATELDNGIDDDCDGNTDEGYDSDGDGFTPYGGDCDDTNADINPYALESCNGIDDNCNNDMDEDLGTTTCGVGVCEHTIQNCVAGVTQTCDPFEGASNEVCDGLDNDCDGTTDEDLTPQLNSKQDGICQGSTQTCSGIQGWTDDYTQVANYEDSEASCDTLDNDCDSLIDENLETTFYQDSDSDNYGNPASTQDACTQPQDYVSNNQDCDDTNADVNPDKTEICNNIDDNCNGQIDEGCDDDNDDYCDSSMTYIVSNECPNGANDCNDNNADVNPSALESCNSIDDNCNNEIDEENSQGCTVYYLDNDNDAYGSTDNKCLCAASDPYDSTTNDDCNDNDINVHPNMDEFCNGIDDDCDGETDEEDSIYCIVYFFDSDGDSYGSSENKCLCSPENSYDTQLDGDCDDTDLGVNPGLTEIIYNSKDDDCNSNTPDDDLDQDGYPLATDCNDNDPNINPGMDELCNNIDDNCNNQVDEGCDDDNDDYCNSNMLLIGTPAVCGNGGNDCDDNNNTINPGAIEIPYDGIDQDCNDFDLTDVDNDGYNHPEDCNDNNANIYPGANEIPYNGIDENCDGSDLTDLDNDGYDFTLDCNDNDNTIYPGAVETPYDDIDQDCNGKDLADLDNDNYNYPEDCDDSNPNINPGQNEIPNNSIDDDCNANTLDNDSDQDGIPDNQDNCPNVANQNQVDLDNDNTGDACDQYPNDFDNDGFDDNIDNCPTAYNPNQQDLDNDNIGDVCENEPTLNVNDITVVEGETVTITPQVFDADNDLLFISISDPVGNDGIWQTKYGDRGTYTVTITVTDGLFTVTKKITITVKEKPYEDIQVARIRFNTDYVKPGDRLEAYVTLEATGNVKSKEVKVTATIPELGVYKSLGRFDLKTSVTKKLYLEIPSWVEPGEYDLRIVISNDNVRRVKHRPIIVI